MLPADSGTCAYPDDAVRIVGGFQGPAFQLTTDERERIKSQWQEPPADYPVRVLLATDAAAVLVGQRPSEALITEAGRLAAAASSSRSAVDRPSFLPASMSSWLATPRSSIRTAELR